MESTEYGVERGEGVGLNGIGWDRGENTEL